MDIKTSDKRLLKLAAFLEKLPRDRFDYASFVGDDWKGTQDLSCGTTACALGWAATIPEFRRAGLTIKAIPDIDGGFYADVCTKKHSGGFKAASEIFGLSNSDSSYLFAPDDEYPEKATPKQVAKKIRNFVKERAKMYAQHTQIENLTVRAEADEEYYPSES